VSLLNDPKLEALLFALHAQSEGQTDAMREYFARRAKEGTLDWNRFDAQTDRFFADKLVALEHDKAQFCYAQCRALRATCVVEAGTSFGVSTLYLAAAIRDNGIMQRSDRPSNDSGGIVVATEY
jgi:predicted O-methyltransferase YrrM